MAGTARHTVWLINLHVFHIQYFKFAGFDRQYNFTSGHILDVFDVGLHKIILTDGNGNFYILFFYQKIYKNEDDVIFAAVYNKKACSLTPGI